MTSGRAALAIGAVAGIVASVLLGSIPIALLAAAVPWFLVATRRVGLAVGVSAVVLGAGSTLVGCLIVSRLVGGGVWVSIGVLALIALVGVAAVLRGQQSERAEPWQPTVVALIGPAIWGVFQTLSLLLPVANRLSWVMRNDSLNNLQLARVIIEGGGIAVGENENPAPLPSAILAIFMLPGRSGVDSSRLLEHDLAAIALAWGCLIALTCWLAGLLAASLARINGASLALQNLAALLGSLVLL